MSSSYHATARTVSTVSDRQGTFQQLGGKRSAVWLLLCSLTIVTTLTTTLIMPLTMTATDNGHTSNMTSLNKMWLTKFHESFLEAAGVWMHGGVIHKAQAHIAEGRYQVQQARVHSASHTYHVVSSIILSHCKPVDPTWLSTSMHALNIWCWCVMVSQLMSVDSPDES